MDVKINKFWKKTKKCNCIGALQDLIDHFERLDSLARSQYPGPSVNETLQYAIEAVFHNNSKDGEITLLIIMDALKPLIENRYK